MGLPNQFNDIIQSHLNIFAAWVPVVNKYALGDYGFFSDGVFSKIGNITDDFGLTFNTGSGSNASIDFTSANTRVIKFNAGAEVSVIPEGAVDARIEIEFESATSFLVRSPTITVTTIENINTVANEIKKIKDWDGKWKVVHQVYNALDPVIVSSMAAGTKIVFGGEIKALQELKLGSAGVNISTNKELGLKIQGQNGVIGLGLFRVRTRIFGGKVLEVLAEDLELGEQKPFIILDPATTKDDLLEESKSK